MRGATVKRNKAGGSLKSKEADYEKACGAFKKRKNSLQAKQHVRVAIAEVFKLPGRVGNVGTGSLRTKQKHERSSRMPVLQALSV